MLKNPVYFVHGLFINKGAYDKLSTWSEYAKSLGVEFYTHERPRGLVSYQRADLIIESLNKDVLKNKKIHLLGHSAGGIDTRLVPHLSKDLRDRIISITSIGTPHHGTPIADAWANYEKCPVLDYLVDDLSTTAGSILFEMTTKASIEFNKRYQNFHNIKYFSLPHYIHSIYYSVSSFNSWKFLKDKGHSYNDGTVPFHSQIWGETVGDKKVSVYNGNWGCHKSETFPLRYGLNRINNNVLLKVFQKLKTVENETN